MRPGTAPDAGGSWAGLLDDSSDLGFKVMRPGTSAADRRDGKKKKKKKKKSKSKKARDDFGMSLVSSHGADRRTGKGKKVLTDDISLTDKQALADKYANRASSLAESLRRSNKAIETISSKILEEKRKRKQMGGVKALKIVEHSIAKQVRILENRHNKISIRSCEIKAENNKTRSVIDALRSERLTFERSYKRLQRDFKSKQRDMSAILSQSNEFYIGRRLALEKLQKMQEESQQDELAFAEEYEELETLVNEHAKLSNYTQATDKKRNQRDLEEQLAAGNLDPEDELRLRAKLDALLQEGKVAEENISRNDRNMQSYEEAFEKLYEHSGINDIQVIVDTFVRKEDENFSLFNFIQQANRETEREENNVRRVQNELAKYKNELGQADSNRERIVAELQSRLERINKQCADLGAVGEEQDQTLKSVAEATEHFFMAIGCHSSSGLEGFRSGTADAPDESNPAKLQGEVASSQAISPNPAATRHRSKADLANLSSPQGESAPNSPVSPQAREEAKRRMSALSMRLGDKVTEKNIMLYLGVVEQRTNEILQLYRKYCSRRNSYTQRTPGLSSTGLPIPSYPKGANKIMVHAPPCDKSIEHRNALDGLRRHADGHDDDHEVERPMSSEQLREMTMRENQPSD